MEQYSLDIMLSSFSSWVLSFQTIIIWNLKLIATKLTYSNEDCR
jgi:hypothetical protein